MDNTNSPIVTTFSNNPNAESQTIGVYGTVENDGGFTTTRIKTGWYKVCIKENVNDNWEDHVIIDKNYANTNYVRIVSGSIAPQPYDEWGSGFYDISPISFKMKGRHVGALRIQQRVDVEDFWGSHSTQTASTDYVYLISGEGHINIVGYTQYQVPMFEIGETVPIHVVCDYSGQTGQGNGGWELWAHPQASEHPLGNFKIASFSDMTDITYNWVLPDGIWYRGISDSKIKLKLRNTLFPQDEVMVNTIDLKANAPPTPTVELSNYNPLMGEYVEVSGNCYTNEFTNAEIEKFMVRVKYKDNGQEIGYWNNINAEGQDPSSYTHSFSIPRAGPIRVTVWAHDVDGRESDPPGIADLEGHQGDHRWTIIVKSQGTSLPLQGVKVLLYPGGSEKTTPSSGTVWFDIPTGYYQASVYKEGYGQKTINKQIDSDEETTVFLIQSAIIWDLTVTVKDGDGNAIPYATIKVGAVSEAYSEEDGSFTFENIPEGDYVVSATKGEYSGTKEVHLDGNKAIDVVIVKGGTSPGDLDYIKMAISGLIIAIFGVLSFFFKLPLPFGALINKVILILIGVVIAVLYYLGLFGI